MKTIVIIATCVLILISGALVFERPGACAAASSVGPRVSSADESSLEQQIVSKEREELNDLTTSDVNRFAQLLADDAVFVDAAGPAEKAQVVKNVTGFVLSDYSMEDIRFVPISANSGSNHLPNSREGNVSRQLV